MRADEAAKIIAAIRECIDDPAARGQLVKPTNGAKADERPAVRPPMPGDIQVMRPSDEPNFEALYRKIKARLIEDGRVDPMLLQLITAQNEIVVEIEPRVVRLDGSTLKGRVARLMAQGWFASARTTSACRKELARTGTDPGGGGQLSDALGAYVRDGFLTREGDGYILAPGVKVREEEISVT
jgi:hypothetical protein